MDVLNTPAAWAALAFGYLLGSIPFGLILTRMAGLGDVRKIGSGNIGATNVLRTGNKGLAALTLVLDALKGTVAVLIAHHVGGSYGIAILAGLLAGIGAFFGHLFPVWLNFKGGKGVATYIGVLLGLLWPAGLLFCAIWIGVAFLTRYSSLSALFASVVTPAILLFVFDDRPTALVAAIMTVLLLWKHRSNIGRLLRGEEPKIGAAA